MYSRTPAAAPNTAIDKKTVPVTSSHKECIARPNDRTVVMAAPVSALNRRLRPACCWTCCWTCCCTVRAAVPNFRKAETEITASILTASDDTMTQLVLGANRSPAVRHLKEL